MTTQTLQMHMPLSDYIFCIDINITLHDPFPAFILFMFSFVPMTAIGLSIFLFIIARKNSKRLLTILEESNETIF